MEVQGPFTGRQARLAVSAVLDSMKIAQGAFPNLTYNVELQIQTQPGQLPEADALSYVNRILGALMALPDDGGVGLRLVVNVVHPAEQDIAKRAMKNYEAQAALLQPKQELIMPPGVAKETV